MIAAWIMFNLEEEDEEEIREDVEVHSGALTLLTLFKVTKVTLGFDLFPDIVPSPL